MSGEILVVKLNLGGIVKLFLCLSICMPLQALQWDWWFARCNFTGRNAQVTCIWEGKDRRPEFERRIDAYLAADVEQRKDLAKERELEIACEQLTDALHAALVDSLRAGKPHFISADDLLLMQHLEDVLNDTHYTSERREHTRVIMISTRNLAEVREFIPKNITAIAHTPKIVIASTCFLAAGYVLYMKYSDKITQLAHQAEEAVEEEVSEAGHVLAHAITEYGKPNEKPKDDEKHP
jgi:hypothetical protein